MPKLANTIHIRDFIDDIFPDSSRPNAPNCVEIHSNINIFPEDEFYDLNVVVEPIHTCIRTYLKQTERSLYTPNAFFYVDGRFITALNPEGNLEITVYALSIERHPGNVSDFKNYRENLPEQWCPIIMMLGFVGDRNVAPGEQYTLRNFELTSSIYDATKAEAIEFSVTCYFGSGRRWENMIVPNTDSFVSVTAKVVGRTSTNQLAVRVLDLTYLPKPPSYNTPATPSNAKKRQDRWGGRAQSSPSKKPRLLTSSQDSVESTHTEMDFDDEERTDTPPSTQINQSSSSVRTQDVEVIDDDAPNVPPVPERRHRKQRRH
ncbi:hypothetical protein EDB80DRAFT_591255 [Ilyonectria destructans]|nr:hypothetical protein EDB80DRAFT_591255 [Ilyonectria destructans]